MDIKLQKRFAANSAVDEFDVRQMKKALNRLGYYQPYEKIGITRIPDASLFMALKAFQQDHQLSPTAEAKPDDATVRALNVQLSKPSAGYYVWRTVGDDRVRAGHAIYDWEVRAWNDAPDPGEDYNCRCWAVPATQIEAERKKNQKNFSELPWDRGAKDSIIKYEDNVEHPYIDTAFKITVGPGLNIDSKTKFISLPWRMNSATGPTATAEQIEAAYKELIRQKDNPDNIKMIVSNGVKQKVFNVRARDENNMQVSWTNLWLPKDKLEQIFEEKFIYFYSILRTKRFAGFDSFPPEAKQALMDMMFNLGETKFSRSNWPKLFKAVNQRDWQAAARESNRRIPNDESDRNQNIYNLFIKASEKDSPQKR